MDHALTPSNAALPKVESSTSKKSRQKNKQGSHPDRIRINGEAVKRLNSWGEQMQNRLRGVKLSRSDLVDFLILSHPDALSATEMRDLHTQHFDEIKLVQWALTEMVAAKSRGEDISFEDIMTQYKPLETDRTATKKRRKDHPKSSERPLEKPQNNLNTSATETPISIDNSLEK